MYNLADVITNNTSLEALLLGGNNLQSSVDVIFHSLKKNSNLKIFELDNNSLLEEAVNDLADVISSNTGLEQLSLNNNNLKTSAVVLLEALSAISTLKRFDLSGNNMSGAVVNELASVIKSNASLEVLNLSNNNLCSPITVILEALKGIETLKALNLDGNSMSEDVADYLADVITKNIHLEELHLLNNNLQESVAVVLQALKGISYFKRLDLNSNNMSGIVANDLANVITNNPCLQSLDLSGNNLQSSAIVIFQALKEISSIKHLLLNDNNMSEEVVHDLADVIRSNICLEALALRGNNLKSSSVVILRALTEMSTLKNLDISNNNMTGVVADELANVIKHNTSLEILVLSNNNLGSSAVVVLEALSAISTLKGLDLSDNNMSGAVVNELANVIKNNVSLEMLSLCNNNLQSSAIVVFEALKKILNLTVLFCNDNNMSYKVVESLADVIKTNSNLQYLTLRNNNLQSSATLILQALKGVYTLIALDLDDNNMQEIVLDDLMYVISNNNKLSYLCIGGNDLRTDINTVLYVVPSLTTVFLNDNNFSSSSVNGIAALLSGNNITIKEIWLGGNILENGLLDIVKKCSSFPNLEIMELSRSSCNSTTVVNLAYAAGSITTLKSLMFGGVIFSSDEYFYVRCIDRFQISSNISFCTSSERLEVVTLEMQKYLFSYYIKYSFSWSVRSFCTHVKLYRFLYVTKQFNSTSSSVLKTFHQQIDSASVTHAFI